MGEFLFRRLTGMVRRLTNSATSMSYTKTAPLVRGPRPLAHIPNPTGATGRGSCKNRMTTIEQLERYMTLTPRRRPAASSPSHKARPRDHALLLQPDRPDDPDCPIRKQVIPRADEMQ
jgi:hypothetical protein